MDRILSLIPAATEIVAALGFERLLVGRTHECDWPQSVLGVPIVTQSRIDPSASSSDIDQTVRTMAASNQSLFVLDEERIRELAPTVIITQSLCAVCAVDDRDVCRIAGGMTPSPTIVRMQPMTLDDVFGDIGNLGAVLQCGAVASQLILSLKRRVYRCVLRGSIQSPRPRILLLEWLDPFFSAGHWNPQLIALAGGEPVLAENGSISKTVTLEMIQAADPDMIVLAPCGFGLDRAISEASLLEKNPGWLSLRAVQNGQVFTMDGSQYFNRPGPRLVDSLELLSEVMGTLQRESDSYANLQPG